jgi:calmodulin
MMDGRRQMADGGWWISYKGWSCTPPSKLIAQTIKAVDGDRNGSIDFLEFLSMMATIGIDGGGQILIEQFRVFNKNGDRLISVMELKYVMSKFGKC